MPALRRAIPLAVSLACGCGGGGSPFPPQPAIPDIPHAGDRGDAPPLSERGNAVFQTAAFDEEGTLLLTVPFLKPGGGGIQVWDASSGALLAQVPAVLPDRLWMIDGLRGRLLARPLTGKGLRLFDLRTGGELGGLPEGAADEPARPAGLAGDGNSVLLFKPGWLELWRLDPPGLLKRAPSPFSSERFAPGCVGGLPATYNEKSCWEWSPDRRKLAAAYTPVFSPLSASRFLVIDAETLEVRELDFPEPRASRTLAAFAFSPDGRRLAIGSDDGLRVFDLESGRWGPAIAGDHKRNRYLGAMRFSPDGERVIALGDQLQVSVYDAATGRRAGRREPPDWDWEGEFRASRDGSRVVLYHFVSDTFEVLAGEDARRLGWVCPYFCNAKHNPIQPPFAVSPDGSSVAISHRRGTAVWDTGSDRLKFPLRDPGRPPLGD